MRSEKTGERNNTLEEPVGSICFESLYMLSLLNSASILHYACYDI